MPVPRTAELSALRRLGWDQLSSWVSVFPSIPNCGSVSPKCWGLLLEVNSV